MPLRGHIFIVGVSRSGTSLMRRIFNRSTQVALLDETFYVGHLVPRLAVRHRFRRFGDLRDDANIHRLVDYFYSPAFRRYSRFKHLTWQWEWFLENVPPERLRERFLAAERSEAGLFAVLMELFAESQGAEVGGEKTPYHIRHVETLKAWYPDARFIHMMRDPRAIFVSEVRRRTTNPVTPLYRALRRVPPLLKLFLLVQVTRTWADAWRRRQQYRERLGDDYRVVRFEDLVGAPEKTVRELCRWLDLEFQPAMLEQKAISYSERAGQKGFDTGATERWRARIPGWADRWFRHRFREELIEMGYRP